MADIVVSHQTLSNRDPSCQAGDVPEALARVEAEQDDAFPFTGGMGENVLEFLDRERTALGSICFATPQCVELRGRILLGDANLRQRVCNKFGLTHDVLRHTFISMFVAKFRSMGEAALQAGNSESIIRKHYLDLKSKEESEQFLGIVPAISGTSGERASRVPAPRHELVVAA